MSMDLHGFLEKHRGTYLEIDRPVKLDHVGALVAQANDTIVFDHLEGYPAIAWWTTCSSSARRRRGSLAASRTRSCRASRRCSRAGPSRCTSSTADRARTGCSPATTSTCQCCRSCGTPSSTPIPTPPASPSTAIPRRAVQRHVPALRGAWPQRDGHLVRDADGQPDPGAHRAAGTRMPQAVAIGVHPAWELAACYSHPHDDWWELELFEAITGKPGVVTRCKTVDLLVPADASIVIEGYRRARRGRPRTVPAPGRRCCSLPTRRSSRCSR